MMHGVKTFAVDSEMDENEEVGDGFTVLTLISSSSIFQKKKVTKRSFCSLYL